MKISTLIVKRRAVDSYPEGQTTWRMLMCGRSAELQEYHREMGRRALRPGSIDARMSVLVRCELAVGHPLIESVTDELRDWLDRRPLNAKTRYAYISHLASFWRWALAEELVARNPTLRLTRPKLRRTLPRPISTEDLRTLIDQAPTAEIRAMVTLGGYAGLRCMEIAGLDASDIMEQMKPPVLVVTHGKGDKPRIVPMSMTIVVALRAHRVPSYGPVFHDEHGDPLMPWRVSHILRTHMQTCGVTGSAHQLRHAFGTEVYRRSHDLRLTQELMGHSTPIPTAGYVAWAQDHAAEVVAELYT